MAILTQSIPSMTKVGFESFVRDVRIINIIINDDDFTDQPKELYIRHRIFYKNSADEDVTATMNHKIREVHIHNNMTMWVRDENFQPIPNPAYADVLSRTQLSEDDENYLPIEALNDVTEYIEAPGYDYIMSVMQARPDLIWELLRGYILDNYNDGYYDDF